ncbi:MAG: ABC transporter permease [Salinisphaera sp.]|nr:ABC transporter permease [Salinisphaera sp.]MDN5940150.1 ABC transporter permease [Salinisphaera sp.]
MNDFGQAFAAAFRLLIEFDPDLLGIVALSLRVSLTATLLAALVGLPLGGAVALYPFPGRSIVKALLNACMGLPPVVVGLTVYLLLSRSGPLGELGLLFTPKAMIIAQAILVTPIIAALTRQHIADLDAEYRDQLAALNTGPAARLTTLLWDGRFALLTVLLAGFGRAIAEVGAVIIVGGNIAHVTRVMTTTIALETSKGNLSLALALGIILISITLVINLAAMHIHDAAVRRYG